MLQACLNGGRGRDEAPAVPLSPPELAREAAAARAAGAACLHIHARDAAGAETLAPAEMGAMLDTVRARVPGMAISVGTGAWIAPGGLARLALIDAWETLPDEASVNLHEPCAAETIAMLSGKGIAIEAGVWSSADAERFLEWVDPAHCRRVLVEMPDTLPAEALAEADRVLAILSRAPILPPVLLHGEGRSAWACLSRAWALGLDSRAGFEDMTQLPDGSPAPDNAAILRAALAPETARG